MRLPKEADLSREQREVCNLYSDDVSLVIGPPGSGKTVVAIYTRQLLEKMEEEVTATAWNNVLSVYSNMEMTFEKWLGTWWRRLTKEPFPYYSEPGTYMRRPDYPTAIKRLNDQYTEVISRDNYWGQLILDEAQDLPPSAHTFLAIVRTISENSANGPSSILVLADENQRITSSSASLDEIKEAMFLTDDSVYQLRKNYRNTEQIAKFARIFFIGTKSGMPELPERQGERPVIYKNIKQAATVDKIVNYAQTYPNHEIGVLVNFTKQRRTFFKQLEKKLKGTRIKLQTYGSSKEEKSKVKKMKFDNGSVITVLCYASAKGLEFDHVFLPELHNLPLNRDDDLDVQRMNMYVMTSRARHGLTLLMDDADLGSYFWQLLPGHNELSNLADLRG
jgi:DNA helicase II / ATP-dependent DNA helicase PcrA